MWSFMARTPASEQMANTRLTLADLNRALRQAIHDPAPTDSRMGEISANLRFRGDLLAAGVAATEEDLSTGEALAEFIRKEQSRVATELARLAQLRAHLSQPAEYQGPLISVRG